MNYQIDIPLMPVFYPGPSKTITMLSSCLWFHHSGGTEDTIFFAYDTLDTFAFGLRSGATIISKINGSPGY